MKRGKKLTVRLVKAFFFRFAMRWRTRTKTTPRSSHLVKQFIGGYL